MNQPVEKQPWHDAPHRDVGGRLRVDRFFVMFCMATAMVSVVVLAVLLIAILVQGLPHLSWSFLTSIPNPDPEKAGIWPALGGTIWVCTVCALFSLPIGVATAVFLEEFKPKNKAVRFFHSLIQLNITNLAGVPSVVYGIIGVAAFVAMFGMLGQPNNPSFELGVRWYDQYGAANSNGDRIVEFLVDRQTSPKVELSQGLRAKTSSGTQKVQLINAWEPVPTSEDEDGAVIRLGSQAERVEEEGQFYDRFVTFAGTTLRVPVEGKDAPPTELIPPLKALKPDGSSTYVKVLESERLPSVEMPITAKSKRVTVDGKPMDEFKTQDGYKVRVPVQTAGAEPTKITDGSKLMAFTEQGNRLSLIGTKRGRPGAYKARFDEMLRAEPKPGRNPKASWYYFRLPIGRGVLAGSLTLMLVILPVVIIASQESLKAVPNSLREGALGLGATPWKVVRNVTLPAAIPGIMTGSILAMSRAIGEAAPILIICGIVFIGYSPGNLMDNFTVMPLQIYNWASLPNVEFQKVAAAGIIVLLTVLLFFNGLAVFLRQKFQKPLS